jgi:hypothetical protein
MKAPAVRINYAIEGAREYGKLEPMIGGFMRIINPGGFGKTGYRKVCRPARSPAILPAGTPFSR